MWMISGLKECMSKGYIYLEGVEELLQRLLSAGFTMHAFSNYPCWYTMIEDKLQLSNYMPWTFVSCHMGMTPFHHYSMQLMWVEVPAMRLVCAIEESEEETLHT